MPMDDQWIAQARAQTVFKHSRVCITHDSFQMIKTDPLQYAARLNIIRNLLVFRDIEREQGRMLWAQSRRGSRKACVALSHSVIISRSYQ